MDRTRRAIDFRTDLFGAPQEITVSLSVFAVVVDRNVRLRIIAHAIGLRVLLQAPRQRRLEMERSLKIGRWGLPTPAPFVSSSLR
jgi:hypothetical protein